MDLRSFSSGFFCLAFFAVTAVLSSCSANSGSQSSPISQSGSSSPPPSLSDQFERVEKTAENQAVSEEQRQFQFLGRHIIFAYPPVPNTPYTFAYGLDSKDIKVFVCDEVRDGLVPENRKCWLSPGQDLNGWRINDVVNQYPSKVSFTVFIPSRKYPNGVRDSQGRDYVPAKTVEQEIIFGARYGSFIPAKTYFKTSFGGSPGGPVILFDGFSRTIDKGCEVGEMPFTWGFIDGKLKPDNGTLSSRPEYKKGPFRCQQGTAQ